MTVRTTVAAWAIQLVAATMALAQTQGTIRLREAFAPGYQYHVSIREDLTGELKLPSEDTKPAAPVKVRGNGAVEYDERILDAGSPTKTLRIYRQIELKRFLGDQPQETTLRPAVRRLVLLRHGHREVPFSPDAPLKWEEIDLVSKDVFTPALATGLLPDRPVLPGDRWAASRSAVEELTDLEQIEGGLDCHFERITTLNGRRLARVSFRGTVRGVNEDGPNRQTLDGFLYFDLQSNHLSYLSLEGTHFLLDKDGREAGHVKGQFVLVRQVHTNKPELADTALRGLSLEPNADNTLLLYDNPELGVRFLYPRRWRVELVRGRQVTLGEAKGGTGNGLLLTVEPPANVPTAAAFLSENQTYLAKEKAKVVGGDRPRRISGPPDELDQFGLDVEMAGRRERLEYYVVRQPGGGATVAARLRPNDLAAVQREVERIARSVRITAATGPVPIPPPGK